MNSLVSIIIPCYNAEKYISDTIQSVINQTYTNWELIIVNDGSTDKSKQIIEQLSQNEPRIKYYEKLNSGVSNTRNKGLEIANGDFITFLDADDVWEDTFLSKTTRLLSNFDIVYARCCLINEHSKSINIYLGGESNPSLDDFLEQRNNYNTNPSGIIYQKYVFDNFEGFDKNLSNNADQDILIQLLAKGFSIGYEDEVLWKYRMHDNNMSKSVTTLEKDTLYLFKKCSSMKLFKSFAFKQKCYSKMYLMLGGSWWKNGENKLRGVYFIILSILNYPPQLITLIKKGLKIE